MPEVFGSPSTTSDSLTMPPTFSEKAPFCHAVVRLLCAPVRELDVTAHTTVVPESIAAAVSNRMPRRAPGPAPILLARPLAEL